MRFDYRNAFDCPHSRKSCKAWLPQSVEDMVDAVHRLRGAEFIEREVPRPNACALPDRQEAVVFRSRVEEMATFPCQPE